jgi:hypothetical protein
MTWHAADRVAVRVREMCLMAKERERALSLQLERSKVQFAPVRVEDPIALTDSYQSLPLSSTSLH